MQIVQKNHYINFNTNPHNLMGSDSHIGPDTLFIREYNRIVYSSIDTVKWPIGEMAVYREILEKRKGPYCDN